MYLKLHAIGFSTYRDQDNNPVITTQLPAPVLVPDTVAICRVEGSRDSPIIQVGQAMVVLEKTPHVFQETLDDIVEALKWLGEKKPLVVDVKAVLETKHQAIGAMRHLAGPVAE